MKKIILLAIFFCLSSSAVAQTEICPSVSDILNNNYIYWLPEYKDNEELASMQDVAKFEQHVTAFVVARWERDYQENGHCFYQGTDPIIDKIVFARDAYRPVVSLKWVWARPDFLAECYSNDVTDCPFIM